MTVELKNLQCVKQSADAGFSRRPLSELELRDHIHGSIVLQPDKGTPFHSFGYWDANDACLGQWLTVFNRLQQNFLAGADFVYEFPYPDQGDPRLEFVLAGDTATIRTTYYTNDSWSEIEDCSEQSTTRLELEKLVSDALGMIQQTVVEASPQVGPAWLARNRGY
jgi:hypothetical protein